MKKKSLLKSDPMKMRSKIGLCPLWVFSFKQSSVLNFKYFLVYLYIHSLSFTYGATYFPIRTLSKFVSDFTFIFFSYLFISLSLAPSLSLIPLQNFCKERKSGRCGRNFFYVKHKNKNWALASKKIKFEHKRC